MLVYSKWKEIYKRNYIKIKEYLLKFDDLTREFREAPNGAVNSCIPELGKFKILKLRLLP